MNAMLPSDQLKDLIDAACRGVIGEEQLHTLDAVLSEDDQARELYVDYFELHMELYWLIGRSHTAGVPSSLQEHSPHESEPPFAAQPSSSPAYSFLTTAVHGTIGYFSQEMPFSLLTGAALTGLLVLIAWLVPLSRPTPIARNASPMPSVIQRQSTPAPKMEFVGQITGMVDVKWADVQTSTTYGAGIPVGRKYALASGLMEITYETGAKVILQGPVTYEVHSRDGGFLSVGKLTASLDNAKPQTANQKSSRSTIHYPLFTITTPTATVTDLGTEFGVEVDGEGVTRTETFVGMVRVVPVASQNTKAGQTLRAGQTAMVHAKNAQVVVVADVDNKSQPRFVRVLPPCNRLTRRDTDDNAYANRVLSMRPVVYYRMERPKDEKDRDVLVDSAPGAHHGMFHLGDEFGQPYLQGRFGQSLSLRQAGAGDFAFVPHYPQTKTNQLSFSAWAMADSRNYLARIAGIGASYTRTRGFRLFMMPESPALGLKVEQADGSEVFIHEDGTQPFPLYRWQHVAFVADGSTLLLYHNGQEVVRAPCKGILYNTPEACLGIGCINNESDPALKSGGCGWHGRFDEVAVFHHALTPDQVKQLAQGADEKSSTF